MVTCSPKKGSVFWLEGIRLWILERKGGEEGKGKHG